MKTQIVYHPLWAEQKPLADIFFNYEAFLPNTVTPKHQHPWGQLQLISGGIMELHAAGQRFLSPSQYAIWVPAGIEHKSYTRRSIHYCSMNIVVGQTLGFPLETCLLSVTPIAQSIVNDLRERGVKVAETLADKRLVKVLLDQLTLGQALPQFLPNATDRLLYPLLQALEADPASPKTFKTWAGELHTTERTLARRCQQVLGMSFTELRQRHKFIYSLQLLRQGLAIKEVALTLGYNQTSPYIVMFKKYAQCSPEQYRRRLG
ncbi:helix-turn-helix transcriptional regulator [Shewanella glacialipiscicola]|uniref:AraC family transcriptional regulator n=1 Tax=Shewanella glacialipiscicola TaxID=614069 RepID=UPI0021DB022E|nr:helix-turn-helix transcriptional regulator [Shewanella glacialipiscicola]MCU7996099.1 helix-turn-helix transcriptional regulator [Shewanella glacialipiscicola]MCU8027352.1 helix-turn-helix transcriptional regulator [Shewanella glacialipiscicola]